MRIIFGILLSLVVYAQSWAGITASAAVGNPGISSSAPDLTSNWTISLHFAHFKAGGDVNSSFFPVWNRATTAFTSASCAQVEIVYYTASGAGPPVETAGGIGVFTVFVPANNTGHKVLDSVSTISTTDINYHHIGLTRSGNVWTLYIDGVQDNQVTDSTAQQTGCNFGFGNDGPGDDCGNSGSGMHCLWAEYAGSTAVATAGQMTALAKGSSLALVGLPVTYYWPFYIAGPLADYGGGKWNGAGGGGGPQNANHCACGRPTGEGH